MKPVIGMTPSPSEDILTHGTFTRYAMAQPYVEAVLAAGGIPVVLPPQDDHAGALLERVDGLLLSGGGDVEPARFGDDVIHPATYGIHPLRDRFEIDLTATALERDLPLFCICRGIQVLNVALGGTLMQHVPDQHPDAVPHRQHESGLKPDDISHPVLAVPGSLLERIYGGDQIGVNSYHHQGIKAVAPLLEVAGNAPDGLIEAVTLPGRRFVLGVQWHPELMFQRHPEHLAPFRALVEAALAHHLAGSPA